MLEHGADTGAARNDGITALMAAAAGGHVAVANLLLNHGADAEAVDLSMMAAAAHGHEAVAELLSREWFRFRFDRGIISL